MNKSKLVLFDFNGTILNDTSVFLNSMREVFRFFNKKPPTKDKYFAEIEGDYLKIYTSRGITAGRDRLNEIYEAYYNQHVHPAELHPGVISTLNECQVKGFSLGMITTPKKDLTVPLLKKFEIEKYFSDSYFHVFNKAKYIQIFLKEYSISPANCFYVGDAPSDIRHAKKASVKSIAFLNGFVSEELLKAAEPDYLIKDIYSIIAIVDHDNV